MRLFSGRRLMDRCCIGSSALCIACLLVLSLPGKLPGSVMTADEARSVIGAGCGYVEDGGGTDFGCCSFCWMGGDGISTFAEYRHTDGLCLAWVDAVEHCPCCTWYSCLGSTQCTVSQ
jgi:hypothetical protein